MTNLSTLKNALQAFDYNHMTPYAVGFDRTFDRLFDYVTHQAESTGFPPYNIQKTEDYKFVIEMAVAGFGKKDIEVEVAEGVLAGHTKFNQKVAALYKEMLDLKQKFKEASTIKDLNLLWRDYMGIPLPTSQQIERGEVLEDEYTATYTNPGLQF